MRNLRFLLLRIATVRYPSSCLSSGPAHLAFPETLERVHFVEHLSRLLLRVRFTHSPPPVVVYSLRSVATQDFILRNIYSRPTAPLTGDGHPSDLCHTLIPQFACRSFALEELATNLVADSLTSTANLDCS